MKWFILLFMLPVLATSSCKKSGFLKKSYIRFKVNGDEQVKYTGDETMYQNMEFEFNNRVTLFMGEKSANDYIYIACNRGYDVNTGIFLKDGTAFMLDSLVVDFGAFNHDEYIEGSFYGPAIDSATGNRVMLTEGAFYIHN